MARAESEPVKLQRNAPAPTATSVLLDGIDSPKLASSDPPFQLDSPAIKNVLYKV